MFGLLKLGSHEQVLPDHAKPTVILAHPHCLGWDSGGRSQGGRGLGGSLGRGLRARDLLLHHHLARRVANRGGRRLGRLHHHHELPFAPAGQAPDLGGLFVGEAAGGKRHQGEKGQQDGKDASLHGGKQVSGGLDEVRCEEDL